MTFPKAKGYALKEINYHHIVANMLVLPDHQDAQNHILYAQNYKTIPHNANHQQQRHPERTHRQWKKHELLECSVQSQKVTRLTGKLIIFTIN
jgi:hypothetical protein